VRSWAWVDASAAAAAVAVGSLTVCTRGGICCSWLCCSVASYLTVHNWTYGMSLKPSVWLQGSCYVVSGYRWFAVAAAEVDHRTQKLYL
jgi:hypothetical protein